MVIMKIIELFDIDKYISVSEIKEVTSQNIYRGAGNNFDPRGIFSEEIFGQTPEEQRYRCGYIKLPIHVFNPDVAKNIISRSGGIIRKMAYAEVRCNLVDGVLVPSADGQYCGLKDLYEIWDKIDIRKTLKTRSEDAVTILTKSPKRLLFNDKVLVLPPACRKLGTKNGKMVRSELNTIYMHLIGLKSVSAYTTTNSVYQVYNKIQDGVINIYTFVNKYVGQKDGFFQKRLLAKNTLWTARNVISAPQYKTDESDDISIYRTGYPLDSVCSMFGPFIKYQMKQFLSFNNLRNIHPNPNEVKPDNIANIYDDKTIEDLFRIFLENHGNRFKILYLDPENQLPIMFEAFDVKRNEKISRPFTLTDLMFLSCKTAVVDADRMVYTVRYPIGDLLGAFFTKVHLLSTVNTTTIQYQGQTIKTYPDVNLKMTHNRVATYFSATITMSNSRLKAIGGDYDGDTVKSVGIWSEEANKKAEELMYSKVYNITPQATSVYPIEIECLNGLYGLTKD